MKHYRRASLSRTIIPLFVATAATVAPLYGATRPATVAPKAAVESPTVAPCSNLTDSGVAEMFGKWNLALASLSSSRVAALYWPDAVLLPTVSNIPRTNSASIQDYFDHFLRNFPRGTILSRTVYHGCNMALDMGLYNFALMDAAGKVSAVTARYSFVYTYRGGTWKIQHHHSSAMPEPAAVALDGHDDHEAPPKAALSESSAISTVLARSDGESMQLLPSTPTARIQFESAPRTPSSMLTSEQRRKVGRETVGLRVCARYRGEETLFELSDPAPHVEANEAAVAWARQARWAVIGSTVTSDPVCGQIVVRFSDAGV